MIMSSGSVHEIQNAVLLRFFSDIGVIGVCIMLCSFCAQKLVFPQQKLRLHAQCKCFIINNSTGCVTSFFIMLIPSTWMYSCSFCAYSRFVAFI